MSRELSCGRTPNEPREPADGVPMGRTDLNTHRAVRRTRLHDIAVGALAVLVAPLTSGCFADWTAPWQLQGFPAGSADVSVIVDQRADFGGIFYAYTTNTFRRNGTPRNVPVWGSWGGLTWGYLRDALPVLGAWASVGATWAPEIHRFGSTYLLYYSATVARTAPYHGDGLEHAIGVACSSTVAGPFVDCSPVAYGFAVPVVRDDGRLGAIDPEVVEDRSGRHYLLWSVDWGPAGRHLGTPRRILGCRLKSDMKGCAAAAVELLHGRDEGWERGTVESPSMVWSGARWHLFYSGGNYENSYATGEAVCGSTVLSTCTRIYDGRAIGDGYGGLRNVGGADLVAWNAGEYLAFFHAAPDFVPVPGSDGPRRLYFASVRFPQ